MTATKEHLRDLLEYVRWGDHLLLVAARSVADARYYEEQGISFGSLHKQLVHMMAAQWIWLQRYRGESPNRLENHDDYPKRMDLEQRWPLVHAALFDFLDSRSPKGLARPIEYRNTRGEVYSLALGDMFTHMLDHATYHRGQVNSMIKKAGGTPTAVSYQLFALHKLKHNQP